MPWWPCIYPYGPRKQKFELQLIWLLVGCPVILLAHQRMGVCEELLWGHLPHASLALMGSCLETIFFLSPPGFPCLEPFVIELQTIKPFNCSLRNGSSAMKYPQFVLHYQASFLYVSFFLVSGTKIIKSWHLWLL